MLSTLLVLALTMRELRHWPSIAGISPQSHCGGEENGRIGLSLWLHFIYIYLYIYMQNYYFEFDWCIKHQIYGKGIRWKVMISDNTKPWAWMRHIGIFQSGQKLNMTLKVSWNDRILPISISNLHTRNLKPLLIFLLLLSLLMVRS